MQYNEELDYLEIDREHIYIHYSILFIIGVLYY